MNPEYPVYVISKGRWESRLTSKALERLRVPYSLVVEPQEFDAYAAVIDPAEILVLPFSDLGQGSILARDWVWEHAIESGAKRHWILDDNIRDFRRLHGSKRYRVGDGTTFRAAEQFVDRFENVGLAGMHYSTFAATHPTRALTKPFLLNTRLYSCILILNELPLRWRGRYNEDTDLSLRVLKAGWCTVLFYAFLADKQTTMTMKGGNTDELYQGDGRLEMARSLQRQQPDVTRISRKWGRGQHHVDYRSFRANRLRLRPDAKIPEGVDDFGMALVKRARS